VVSGCCMTMVRQTKRPLYENVWNMKRLSSFLTLLIDHILPPCDIFLFLRLRKPLAGRKYQTRKNLGSAIFQCLNSILRIDFEIGL
jgi:hypothetical protein